MKKFMINTTSTLMSAAVVAGLLVFAAPAKADTTDFVKGAMGLLILKEVFKPYPSHGHYPQQQPVIVQQPPVVHNNTTVIIQDSAWQSSRVCSEEIVRHANGVQSTIQRNCAGRVVGVIDYQRY